MCDLERLKEDVFQAKQLIQRHSEIIAGDYWIWQGDGSDHLESLTCQVVITPTQLIELLANIKPKEHLHHNSDLAGNQENPENERGSNEQTTP